MDIQRLLLAVQHGKLALAEDAIEILNDVLESEPLHAYDLIRVRISIASVARDTDKPHVARAAVRLLDRVFRAANGGSDYASLRYAADRAAKRWQETPAQIVRAGYPAKFREDQYVFYRPGWNLSVFPANQVLAFSRLPFANVSGWQSAVPIYMARAPKTRGWDKVKRS